MSLSVPRDLTLVWETTVSATSNSIVAKGYQSVGISWSDPSSSLQESECGWFSAAKSKRQFWVVVMPYHHQREYVASYDYFSCGYNMCNIFFISFSYVDKQPSKLCQITEEAGRQRKCSLSQEALSISATVSNSEKFIQGLGLRDDKHDNRGCGVKKGWKECWVCFEIPIYTKLVMIPSVLLWEYAFFSNKKYGNFNKICLKIDLWIPSMLFFCYITLFTTF